MASPALTTPPGELMYRLMSLRGSSADSSSSWAHSRLAIRSSTSAPSTMMRCWSSRAFSCSSSGPASGGSAVADGMVFPPSEEWSWAGPDFDVELTVAGLPAQDQENLPSAEDDPAWSADAASQRAWQADLMPESPPSAKATLTSLPYRLAARRIILPWILQDVEPSGEGLEIGAGLGGLTAQLLTLYPQFRMVATDTDVERVGMAEQVLSGFGQRASVQRADATALPFPDGRFDLVVSAAMLHHVIEWDKALAEAVRVLRPGGKLVGYDMLNTAPARLMRVGERQGTTLLHPGQLKTALDHLGLTALQTRSALGGTVMRVAARKPAALE